ncbi:uncharacterized protein LOC121377593 [Gigantopelta aegis]|uniref:uncharacterized protein LOC121377593 n=1 Tax=Gigantopelta aegis TaxID=1735272 RepID=UPI001B88CC9F|nr:uncharacterized protein LOC121377593 [Gigantopelta aegis]
MPVIKLMEIEPNDESVLDLIREALIETRGEIDPVEFEKIIVKKVMATEEDELECVRAAFAVADYDADGFITAADVYKLMMGLGEVIEDAEIMAILKAADLDGDGRISLSDFTHFMMGTSPEDVGASTEGEQVCDEEKGTDTLEEKPDGENDNSKSQPIVIAPVNLQPQDDHAKRRKLFSYIGSQVRKRASIVSLFKRPADKTGDENISSRAKDTDPSEDQADVASNGINGNNSTNKLGSITGSEFPVATGKIDTHSLSVHAGNSVLAKSDLGVMDAVSSIQRKDDNSSRDTPGVTGVTKRVEVIEEVIKGTFVSRYGSNDIIEDTLRQVELCNQPSENLSVCARDDNNKRVIQISEEQRLSPVHSQTDVELESDKLSTMSDDISRPDKEQLYADGIDTPPGTFVSDYATSGDWESECGSMICMHDQEQQTSESSFEDQPDCRHRSSERRILVPTQTILEEEQMKKARLLEKAILQRANTAVDLLRNMATNTKAKIRPKSSYVTAKEKMTQDDEMCLKKLNIVNVSESIDNEPVYDPEKVVVEKHHGFHSIRPLARVIMALNRTRNAARVSQFTSVSRQLEESKLVLSRDNDPVVQCPTKRQSRGVSSAPTSGRRQHMTSEHQLNPDAKSSPTLSRRRNVNLSESQFSSSDNRYSAPGKNLSSLRPKSSPAPYRRDAHSARCKHTSSRWEKVKNSISARTYDYTRSLTSRDIVSQSTGELLGVSDRVCPSDSVLLERPPLPSSKHGQSARVSSKQADDQKNAHIGSPVLSGRRANSARTASNKADDQKHPRPSSSASSIVYGHTIPTSLGDNNETVMSNEFKARRICSASSSRRNLSDSYRETTARPVAAIPGVDASITREYRSSADTASFSSTRDSNTSRTPSLCLLNICLPKENEYKPQFVRTSTLRRIPCVRTMSLRRMPVVRTPSVRSARMYICNYNHVKC